MDAGPRAPQNHGRGRRQLRNLSSMVRWFDYAAFAVALVGTACGGGAAKNRLPRTAAPLTDPVDPATASAITGVVTLQGTPPRIRRSTWLRPHCKLGGDDTRVRRLGRQRTRERVRLCEGWPAPEVPGAVEPGRARPEGLRAYPARVWIQVGQSLDIVNSDETLPTSTPCRWPTASSIAARRCRA